MKIEKCCQCTVQRSYRLQDDSTKCQCHTFDCFVNFFKKINNTMICGAFFEHMKLKVTIETI